MHRARALSLAALWTVLGTAACQDQTGKCSSNAGTLCLQIELADHRTIPDHVKLTASTTSQNRTFEFTNIAAQLTARPYLVEVVFDTAVPGTIDLDAVGSVADSATTSHPVATGKLTMVSPATAARPTSVVLQPIGDHDLGGPAGDLRGTPDDGGTPADLQPVAWNMVYSSPGVPLNALSGVNGPTKIYAAGNNGRVVSGDGTSFAPTTAAGTGMLSGIWVANATTAFACDKANLAFRTTDGGVTWPGINGGFPLSALYGRSATDVLAVGADFTKALQWNGTSWAQVNHGRGTAFSGVFASATYYYVIGNAGNGARTTSSQTLMAGAPLTGGAAFDPWTIAGLGNTDSFTVSASGKGAVQYLTGTATTWTTMNSPVTSALAAVWVPAAATAIVGGASGTVHQYTSGTWTTIGNVASGYSITGLWGDSSGALWATASNGTDGAIFKR